MRRNMSPYVYWLLAISSAELRNVSYRCMIEGPQCILIESLNPFLQSDLYTVCQKIILAKQILLLDASKKGRIIFFPD